MLKFKNPIYKVKFENIPTMLSVKPFVFIFWLMLEVIGQRNIPLVAKTRVILYEAYIVHYVTLRRKK